MKTVLAILLFVSIALNFAQRFYEMALVEKMDHMADGEQVIALAREVERQCIAKATKQMRFEMGTTCT